LAPSAQIVGIDASAQRVAQAQAAAASLPNTRFEQGQLHSLALADGSVDHAVCRFVFQHLNGAAPQLAAARELGRVLKPGGTVHLIDVDGFFDNLYPSTPTLTQAAAQMKSGKLLDMWVGRKLPALLREAGYTEVAWRIEIMDVKGAARVQELALFEERFAHSGPAIDQASGVPGLAHKLKSDLFACLADPLAVMYYNKFIVTARKPV
ncbi:MAG TPA: methyltransferase domain-containing protein, partial [Burkholderiaceae bacterium]